MPFPGVHIGDCGPKVGNDNIDNGFIGFKNYRIPLESLLDKYSQVSEDGVFTTLINNPDIRFATALGALEEGRITVSLACQNILRNAIVIASRFSVLRKQFGLKDKEEYPIISYPMTQIRIIPALADNFAFRVVGVTLGLRWIEITVSLVFKSALPLKPERRKGYRGSCNPLSYQANFDELFTISYSENARINGRSRLLKV
jgi:acyl-CoA oxidase